MESIDRVAEAAFLADLGEEPAGHAAGEDLDRHADDVVVRVGFLDRVVGDADVGLLRLLVFVVVPAGGGLGDDRERLAGLHRAEVLADLGLEFVEVHVAGHREDRAVGSVAAGVVSAGLLSRQRLQFFDLPH